MAEVKLKPDVRFVGFEDDWERRELGEIAQSFEYGLNAAACDFDGENKYLRITDIDDNTHEFIPDALTSPDVDLTSADNYKLQEGDVLFARTGASVGKTYKYKGLDGLVYFAGFLIRARIKPEYDSEFMFQNTLTNRYNRFIRITSQRSGQPGVNAQEYGNFELSTPTLPEQKKIGAIFAALDNFITLHQREYDKTVNIKKAMLEKMFPKDGADRPEIRFAGFTGTWEQRAIGDIAAQTFGGGTPNTSISEYWEGEIPWIQSSDLSENEVFGVTPRKHISTKGLNSSAAKLIPKNSIAVITRVGVGKLAFMPFSYSSSQDFLSLSKLKLDGKFTVYSLYKKLQSELHQVQGTSIKGITKEELLAKVILTPYRDEQRQIGTFFASLDHLLTLHQRELKKLQNIKKALLEKMFV